MDPADMFNQDSDMDQGGSDEDQDIEDDNEEGVQRFGMNNNALGSYLLAPMGFDDDDDPGTSPAVSGYVEAAERFQIFAGVKEFDGNSALNVFTNVNDAFTRLQLQMALNMFCFTVGHDRVGPNWTGGSRVRGHSQEQKERSGTPSGEQTTSRKAVAGLAPR
jgi:hypothetical protein